MCNLIVSTTHNNQAMNEAVRSVAAASTWTAARLTEGLLNHIEVAIRAYDPCLSCATHALGQHAAGRWRCSPAADGSATYALVLAGGVLPGSRLRQLTDHRAKPAVPFAGTMRIVDFALGNCVNSGLRRIGVLTQYKAQSLIRHIERSWGFLEASLGEYVDIVPAQQQHGTNAGTAAPPTRCTRTWTSCASHAQPRAHAGWRPHLQDGLRR
jgi:hypothetical protein